MNKLFIIGLPRTGTTSISVALLDNFKVAHTAYTKHGFGLADVISDCPCFSDFEQLDKLFPNSKFVLLTRQLELWLPSIKRLLNKIVPSLTNDNYVNPILKRSFEVTFDLKNTNTPLDENHLIQCYQRHEKNVMEYFKGRDDLLTIDISQPDSLPALFTFLGLDIQTSTNAHFPHLNTGTLVDHWKEEIRHSNKINSNAAGIEGRKFFDY